MSEEPQPRRHKEPLHRSLFINIEDITLDTPEGQNEMLRRMQLLLSTKDHNALDLNAFKILKDSVKIKTDLNVWILFNRMQKDMQEWKEAQTKPTS